MQNADKMIDDNGVFDHVLLSCYTPMYNVVFVCLYVGR